MTLRTAKISSHADAAASILRRALGLDPAAGADLLPEQAEWRRMDDEARVIALGEWLKSVCYEEAHRIATAPGQVFEPIGGTKYAHQND